MFDSKQILQMLESGQDAEALAQKFTNALNSAIAEKNAAEKAKAQVQEKKIADMNAIIKSLFSFVDTYYPDFTIPEEIKNEIQAVDVISAFDEAEAHVKGLMPFLELISNADSPKVEKKRAGSGSADALQAFLQANGLA